MSGRSRLSYGGEIGHKVTYINDRKDSLPESHTCFFSIHVGEYSDENTMKNKLLYALENCRVISENSGSFDLTEDAFDDQTK